MLLNLGLDDGQTLDKRGLGQFIELGVFGLVVELDGVVVLFFVQVDGDFLDKPDIFAIT